jgi:hypothetical protein
MSCTPNLKLTSQILSITRRRKNFAAKDADGPLVLHSIQDWGMREVNPYEESIMQRKHTNPKPITVSYGKCSLGCNRFPVQWMQDSMYVSCVSSSGVPMSCTLNLKSTSQKSSITARWKKFCSLGWRWFTLPSLNAGLKWIWDVRLYLELECNGDRMAADGTRP